MKRLKIISVAIVVFSCLTGFYYQQKNTKCASKRNYNNTEFCMPIMVGMTEAYSQPKIKKATDEYKFDKRNTILGLYVRNENLKKIDTEGFNNYIKVYGLKQLEGRKVSKSLFSLVREQFISDSSILIWDNIKNDVENKFSELKFGSPMIIEKYNLNGRISTQILLMKMIKNKKEMIKACSFSIAHVKNTIIYYSFYRTYTGPETIDIVKANSDLFGYKFLQSNI